MQGAHIGLNCARVSRRSKMQRKKEEIKGWKGPGKKTLLIQ